MGSCEKHKRRCLYCSTLRLDRTTPPVARPRKLGPLPLRQRTSDIHGRRTATATARQVRYPRLRSSRRKGTVSHLSLREGEGTSKLGRSIRWRVLSPITARPRTPPGVGTPLRASGRSAPPAQARKGNKDRRLGAQVSAPTTRREIPTPKGGENDQQARKELFYMEAGPGAD